MFAGLCIGVQVLVEVGVGSSEAGVTGTCKLPQMDVEN